MTTRLTTGAQWQEPVTSGATVPRSRASFAYDAVLDRWEVVAAVGTLAAGEAVDADVDGIYNLELLGTSPSSAARLSLATLPDGTTLVY